MDESLTFSKRGRLTYHNVEEPGTGAYALMPAVVASEETADEDGPALSKFIFDNIGSDALIIVMLDPEAKCTCGHRHKDHDLQGIEYDEPGRCMVQEWDGCHCHGRYERCTCDQFHKVSE